ncbi:MAG TPA: FAD-dependent oxidoreductase, partial [Candidatus Tectomicrobia bacterium]|nr:FAD-dependent oxidoreductase [Candidatus Tectomicrobia bacterium]
MPVHEAEIAVVGGGIAGASAAWHLAQHGRRVTLLERGEIASGASGVNAGQIDSIGWGDAPDLQAYLTAGSQGMFERVQVDLGEDIEFRRSGALQAIQTPEQLEFTWARVRALRARGHRVELLTNREVRSLEPEWSPALLGAMYSPLRSQADPVKATRAFARLAERTGATVLTGHEVTAIAPRPAG